MAMRLDIFLVEQGLVTSRSRARDLILRGLVSVAGKRETRPARTVTESDIVLVEPGHVQFVSRGAEKLSHALDYFSFNVAEKICLDLGASTGGFCQVLAERGAKKIYAVDVGTRQLHPSLRNSPAICAMENFDARNLERAHVREPVEALTADLSFISLTKALPAAMCLCAPGAWLVALIKPQFEVGREGVGKGGIVRDDAKRLQAIEKVENFIRAQEGWREIGVIPSPIEGGDGNREYLIGAMRSRRG